MFHDTNQTNQIPSAHRTGAGWGPSPPGEDGAPAADGKFTPSPSRSEHDDDGCSSSDSDGFLSWDRSRRRGEHARGSSGEAQTRLDPQPHQSHNIPQQQQQQQQPNQSRMMRENTHHPFAPSNEHDNTSQRQQQYQQQQHQQQQSYQIHQKPPIAGVGVGDEKPLQRRRGTDDMNGYLQQQISVGMEGKSSGQPQWRHPLKYSRTEALNSSLRSSGSSKVSAEYVIRDVLAKPPDSMDAIEDMTSSSKSLLLFEDDNRPSSVDDEYDQEEGEYITARIEKVNLPPTIHSASVGTKQSAPEEGGERPRAYKTPFMTPVAHEQNLTSLPEKRPLEGDITSPTIRSATIPISIEGPSGTPMSMSTISAHPEAAAAAAPGTATARFGRLLEECRILTEDGGDTVSTSTGHNTNRDSSHPSSSTHGAHQQRDNKPRMLSSLHLKAAAAAAAAAANTDALEQRRFSANPVASQQEIDTEKQIKVSTITMDPAIVSSLRSSGFGNSTRLSGHEAPPIELYGAPSEMGAGSKAVPAMGGTSGSVGQSHRLPQRENRKSLTSDLSMGTDLIYGHDAERGLPTGSKTGDQTLLSNQAKFLATMNLSHSAAKVSELNISEHPSEVSASDSILMTTAEKRQRGDRMAATPAVGPLDISEVSASNPVLMTSEERRQRGDLLAKTSALVGEREEIASPRKEELSLERAFWSQKENAGAALTAQPRKETGRRYSWLSYTTDGDSKDEDKLSSSENQTSPNPPKELPPLKPHEPDILESKISNYHLGVSRHSTECSDDASGGLLVGFGHATRKRQQQIRSSASSDNESSGIRSGSSGGTSSSRSSVDSGFSSGSSSESSSESGDETSDSEESDSLPPLIRHGLHIPATNSDNQSDLVSDLSFGGASALMLKQAMKLLKLGAKGQEQRSSEGGSGSGGDQGAGGGSGSGSRSSTPGLSSSGLRTTLSSKSTTQSSKVSSSISPPAAKSGDAHRAFSPSLFPMRSSLAQDATLHKLDEVSESNASFLDDLSSVDEPIVQKFLLKPGNIAGSDFSSSFASTNQGSSLMGAAARNQKPSQRVSPTISKPLIEEEEDVLAKPAEAATSPKAHPELEENGLESSSLSSRSDKLMARSHISDIDVSRGNSSSTSSRLQQHPSGSGTQSRQLSNDDISSTSSSSLLHLPKMTQERINVKSPRSLQSSSSVGIRRHQSSRSLESGGSSKSGLSQHPKSNVSSSSSVSQPTHNSQATSVSSRSYYDGVVARVAAMQAEEMGGEGSLAPSRTSARSGLSRSSRSVLSQLQQNVASVAQRAGIGTVESGHSISSLSDQQQQPREVANEESIISGQVSRQGSGESSLENLRPTGVDNALSRNSNESPMVSKTQNSFEEGSLPVTNALDLATADDATPETIQQMKHSDATSVGSKASSKVSGVSGNSRGHKIAAKSSKNTFLRDSSSFASQRKDVDAMSIGSKMSDFPEEKYIGKSHIMEPPPPNMESSLPIPEYTSSIAVGPAMEMRKKPFVEGEAGAQSPDEFNMPQITLPRKVGHGDSGSVHPTVNHLHEDISSQLSEEAVDTLLRKRSSSTQSVLPTKVETEPRKPWTTTLNRPPADLSETTTPMRKMTATDSTNSTTSHTGSQEHLDYDFKKTDLLDNDRQHDGGLSELFESREAFSLEVESSAAKNGELTELSLNSADDDNKFPVAEEPSAAVARVLGSHSSNESFHSSIMDRDGSSQHGSNIAKGLSTNADNINNMTKQVDWSSSNSSESAGPPNCSTDAEDQLDFVEPTSRANGVINEIAHKPKRSSVRMLAAAASEMSELLQRSMQMKDQQQLLDSDDDISPFESSFQEGSETSAKNLNESLKSSSQSNVQMVKKRTSRSPSPARDKVDEANAKEGEVANYEDSNHRFEHLDKRAESADVAVSFSLEAVSYKLNTTGAASGTSGSSESEFSRMVRHTFRKRGSVKLEKVEDYKAKPNPFLADSSDDEEIGVPQITSPLSIEDADNDESSHGEAAPKKQWGGKYRTLLCCIAMFLIVAAIASVVAYVVVTKTKKTPPDDEASNNNPSVDPHPGNAQTTTPPTPLPTPPPTVIGTPNWVQVGGDLKGQSSGDEAGFSVAISDSGRVIVGARRNAKDGMKNRGAAHIFQFDSKTGSYAPIWDIYGEAAGDQCGFSVSMSTNGKRIAVGCLGSDNNGENSGQVRLYDEDELWNTWILVSELNGDEETSLFGASVSLSQDGSSIAVGAPYHNEGSDMTRSGRAYVYREVKELEWEQVGEPMVGMSSNDLFGWSVSLLPVSAQLVAVGAPRLEGSLDSGYVKVFSSEDDHWKVYGEPMSMGVPGDRFGFSVSLAGDDALQRVAIGAPGMSENGEGSGMASVYENGGSGWQRSGDDLFGDGWRENLGYAVAMSPDGSIMTVGVPNKMLDGLPVGQVRVVDVQSSGSLRSVGNIYGHGGDQFGVSVAVSYEGGLVYGGASAASLVRIYRSY